MQVLKFLRKLCKAFKESSMDESLEAGMGSSTSTTQLGALKPILSNLDIGSRSGLSTSSSVGWTDLSQSQILKSPSKPRVGDMPAPNTLSSDSFMSLQRQSVLSSPQCTTPRKN